MAMRLTVAVLLLSAGALNLLETSAYRLLIHKVHEDSPRHVLYEPCTVRLLNCTTEQDFEVYNCQLGELVKRRDSCMAELHCLSIGINEPSSNHEIQQNGICAPNCTPQDTLVFDHTVKKCVTRVGAKCEPVYGRACQQNAVCKKPFATGHYPIYYGTCQCKPGFVYIKNECIKSMVYGKSCGTNETELPQRNCDPNSNIICKNGACQCASSDQKYYPEENRCFINLDGECETEDEDSCIPGSKCSQSSKCTCLGSRKPSEDGSVCLISRYYFTCDSIDPFEQCDGRLNFECGDNAECKCTSEHIRDSDLEACLLLAGKECKQEIMSISDQNHGPCVQKSVCIEGRCHCMDGYSENQDSICALSYGQPCNYTNVDHQQCNEFHGLSCVNEKCNCTDVHETFNSDTLTCEDALKLDAYENTATELFKSGSVSRNSVFEIPLMVVCFIIIAQFKS